MKNPYIIEKLHKPKSITFTLGKASYKTELLLTEFCLNVNLFMEQN